MTVIDWHSANKTTPPLDPDGTGSVKIMARDAAGDIYSPCRLVNGGYYCRGGMVENVTAWAIMPTTAARRNQVNGE